jgi:hypothetical protein
MAKKIISPVIKVTASAVDVKVKSVIESIVQLIRDKHLS